MQGQSVQTFFINLSKTTQSHLNGYSILQNKIQTQPQFILQSIEFLTSQQQPDQKKQSLYFKIITLLHAPLIQNFSELPEKIQQDIRGGLLNCVISLYKSLKIVASLSLLIRQIIQIDSLDPWLQSFAELLKWIASDQVEIMEAGIQFFIYLLKQTDYNKSNSDLPLYKISSPLLEVLYQIFANSQLKQPIRQKLLFLVLQLIKTFSIFDGSNDAIVKQCFDSTYDIWMSFFISTLQSTIYSNVTIKKYIIKILVVVFRDMQKFLNTKQKDQPEQLYIIWQFCYKMMPLYLWSTVWQKDINQYKNKQSFQSEQTIPIKKQFEELLYFDQDSQGLLTQMESLAFTLLQFISVLTSIPQLNTAVKVSIHHLTNVLFHFMMLPEFDTLFWKNNAQQFLIMNTNVDYQSTIRNKTLGILNELIEKCGDYAIQAILMVSEKFLLNLQQSATTATIKQILQNVIDIKTLREISSNIYQNEQKMFNLIKLSSCDVRQSLKVSGQTWRKMEVSLVVLGRFAEDIIVFQSKQQQAFDIEAFVNGLIKQIKDEDFYQLLKGQSLYCLTRFTQIISIKYRNLFTQLSLSCIACLNQDFALSINAIACKALTIFLRKVQKHKLQFSKEQIQIIVNQDPIQSIMKIPLTTQLTNYVVEGLIQICKNDKISPNLQKPYPQYLLSLFHKNISHSTTIQLFFTLLQQICQDEKQYKRIVQVFVKFIQDCLKSFLNIIKTQQKLSLKTLDTQLILIVLKISNVLILKGIQIQSQLQGQKQLFLSLSQVLAGIIEFNDDIQIHIQITICMKNLIKFTHKEIKAKPQLVQIFVQSIRNLLKIPADKSFQSASVYAGNLAILAFQYILTKNNYQILQEAVLKIFKSRTPSVIQSLVLIYSRLINMKTNQDKPFEISMEKQIQQIVDFLASFSIQNRMGLKILIDKWLLQQSLFRGKYTKISTFMALSKLFLLGDKRIDNLLVIGFNPSHTTVCVDVNAPLKILATLIRCLDNQKGFEKGIQEDEDVQTQEYTMKQQQKTVDVTLQKFKDEKLEGQEAQQNKAQGGLADRQNQQGSTCYMSAMLEFYDDGEQCDETTQEDLIFLQDSSTKFVLSDYLTQFFEYLVINKNEYLKECLKGILKQDVKTLQKYVNVNGNGKN